jgi:tRNA-splicing ligase RtcB
MRAADLQAVGIPAECVPLALEQLRAGYQARTYTGKDDALAVVRAVADAPATFADNPQWGALAHAITAARTQLAADVAVYGQNPHGVPGRFGQWGTDIDPNAIEQMRQAVNLPIAVAGALMPDAHLGYGLPIGGVLATHDSIIPYAVGVDIACRMKLSVLDLPVEQLENPFAPRAEHLARALLRGTVFGVGGTQEAPVEHSVLDRDWSITPITARSKDRARAQLGTSGSGNHFVEFGLLTLETDGLPLPKGRYVALLSHSGSRGTGAAVCQTYVDIARQRLPKTYEHFDKLAWLSLQSAAGQEYWHAMNLMGEYASANHAVIHERVAALAGAQVLASVENHHNFAWIERHHGADVYVHRKGATPAGAGVLGVIPGSMADPAFVVRGKGEPTSLASASHGAGRRMSRSQALKTLDWAEWKQTVAQRGVRLLSAGLDEVPAVYKPIAEVMAAQTDLVDIVARFDPKIVRMSDDGKADD